MRRICFVMITCGLVNCYNFLLKNCFSRGPFKKSLFTLLQYCFCFMFWLLGWEARGIWDLSFEPAPPALEGEVLTTGQPGRPFV